MDHVVAMTTVDHESGTAEVTLINRELSWLDLNERVLELAADTEVPLLERVRFCSIFSSNLDEFFMVRVAGLLDQVAAGVTSRSPDGRTPPEAFAEVRERVLELTTAQSRLWHEELVPVLEAKGIVIGDIADATAEERKELEETFSRLIYPVLTPLAVGARQPFPYISGLSLSVVVSVRDPETGEARFARVKVPETLPRFIAVGARGLLIPLESVITYHLSWLFPGMDLAESAVFRVTRDGDTEISDDADDLLEAVESELRRRRFGAVVRLEVSKTMSPAMTERLAERLGIRPDIVYPISGQLDLADVAQLCRIERPELKYEPWTPHTQRRLEKPRGNDLFSEIASSDIVVHHPYDSFSTSVEQFVTAAAADPDVVTVRTTVYRTSEDSAIAEALIRAAEAGKQSVCVVELKARFDEQRNIEWARSLEKAGVHVSYGFPDMKVHAKTTLVIRREGDGLVRYAHIGTGNYNASTARIYEDLGVFTSDSEIAADIADLFNFVTGFGRPQRFRKILAAPFNLRSELIAHIRAVGAAAAAGERARIRIKVNNLADPTIANELCAASQQGAQIDLVVRAICVLRPGVPGHSENVRVRSVLGRFLEHSRLFCFEAGDQTTYLMGSADLMARNLDHRIEMLIPVEAPHVQAEIETIMQRLLADNSQAWLLSGDGSWARCRPESDELARPSQVIAMRGRVRANRRIPTG